MATATPSAQACGDARRDDDRCVADHLGNGVGVAAHDGRAERHRLDHRRAEPLVLAREHHRRGVRDEHVAIVGRDATGAHDPRAVSTCVDRPSELGLGGTEPAEQHEPQGGVEMIEHVDQDPCALCGWVIAG